MQYSSWKVTVVLTGNLTDAHKYQISTSNGVDVTCGVPLKCERYKKEYHRLSVVVTFLDIDTVVLTGNLTDAHKYQLAMVWTLYAGALEV